MKRLLSLLLVGLFSMSVVGCHAEGEIDDDDADTSYKKTTTIDDDGDRTVKTEKKVERD